MKQPLRMKAPVSESPLETYFREINETPLLTEEEERQLAIRVAEGDYEARDHMARANLRLVVSIARSYIGKGLSLQDLIAEGNLGVLRAVEDFDLSKNTRFSRYASYWINQSIRRALVNTAKMIRLPANVVKLLAKWRRASIKLQEEFGRSPTHEEVAAHLNLSNLKSSMIKNAILIANAVWQRDRTEPGFSLEELPGFGNSEGLGMEMPQQEEIDRAARLLENMEDREAAVLRMRFGLGEEEPKTLHEIGESLGLSRERIRQIEQRALLKLKQGMFIE